MHEFIFVVVTFGGHEINHVTGQRGPDCCSLLISVLAQLLLFFDFLSPNWWHRWTDFRWSDKMGRPAGRTPRPKRTGAVHLGFGVHCLTQTNYFKHLNG
jgi:hypothetical protein